MKNNNRGFTLIEIVMVLVLLGILAAVAVPKYYDLKTNAEKASAQAVAAEYQARVNGRFAHGLLNENEGCAKARYMAVGDANTMKTELNGFTFTDVAVTETGSTKLTLTKGDFSETYDIGLPICKDTYTPGS